MHVVCFVAAFLFYGDVPDKEFRGTIMEERGMLLAFGGLERRLFSNSGKEVCRHKICLWRSVHLARL